MTVDLTTQKRWAVDDAERELANAQDAATIARREEQEAVEKLKGAKAALRQAERRS